MWSGSLLACWASVVLVFPTQPAVRQRDRHGWARCDLGHEAMRPIAPLPAAPVVLEVGRAAQPLRARAARVAPCGIRMTRPPLVPVRLGEPPTRLSSGPRFASAGPRFRRVWTWKSPTWGLPKTRSPVHTSHFFPCQFAQKIDRWAGVRELLKLHAHLRAGVRPGLCRQVCALCHTRSLTQCSSWV